MRRLASGGGSGRNSGAEGAGRAIPCAIRDNRSMNAETRTQLQQIRDSAAGAYAQGAAELLTGSLSWSQEEITQFIDGYVNDPYLTRND